MTLEQLCNAIELQPEVKEKVFSFSRHFDFTAVDGMLKDFMDYGKMGDACAQICNLLGDDEGHMKILTCMLLASARAHEWYQKRGIRDQVFYDTMKCFPRFLNETYTMTGGWDFDRYWWTARQAGCHLFRIGALEYEIMENSEGGRIWIHIPSDADLSPASVAQSFSVAEEFFTQQAPDLLAQGFFCRSWLMDRQLRGMLRSDSNIVNFQRQFEICDEGEPGTEFRTWLFRCKTSGDRHLPEETSLQRNVKRHLLSGGVIRNSCGRRKTT